MIHIVCSVSGAGNNTIGMLLPEAVVTDHLKSRKGHFFDPQLLRPQLNTLETPDYGWVIDAESTPQEIVNIILERLRSE